MMIETIGLGDTVITMEPNWAKKYIRIRKQVVIS